MERKDGVENKAPIPCGSQTFHDVVSTDNLRNNRGIIGRSAGAVKRRCCEPAIQTVGRGRRVRGELTSDGECVEGGSKRRLSHPARIAAVSASLDSGRRRVLMDPRCCRGAVLMRLVEVWGRQVRRVVRFPDRVRFGAG